MVVPPPPLASGAQNLDHQDNRIGQQQHSINQHIDTPPYGDIIYTFRGESIYAYPFNGATDGRTVFITTLSENFGESETPHIF